MTKRDRTADLLNAIYYFLICGSDFLIWVLILYGFLLTD